MLFGKTSDGTTFFDATSYLQKQKPSANLADFFTLFEVPIEALKKEYNLKDNNIHLINEEGHHLIESSLVYLFIAFVEPSFWAYMFDRIHEIFSNGVCLSDTYIFSLVRERLSKEVIMTAMNNGQG